MFHCCGFLMGIGLYLLPALIAHGRNLDSRAAITLFNLFLGWTFIGWVAALIWALTAPAPYYHYYNPPRPPYPPYW